MPRGVTSGLVCVTLLASGCGHHPVSRSLAKHTERVTPAAWRAVIRDWYDNGRFDEPHSCSAVRAAIDHLPVSPLLYSNLPEDFRAYELKVC